MSASGSDQAKPTRGLAELPTDELLHYGGELGLKLDKSMERGELLRRIRDRQELLVELERDAMLDVVVWARRPVRRSASKEQLAKEIATINRMRFDDLSHRGLVALARLRGHKVRRDETSEQIAHRIRKAESLSDMIDRKRRALVGKVVSRIIGEPGGGNEEYRFLPEENGSIQAHIEDEGLVGGIARKIRGAADDYVQQKLDEIERRIDTKLDEIDRRLGEWRDREVANRLKIIKITLAASVLVALLSLGYSYMKPQRHPDATPAAQSTSTADESVASDR